MKALKFTIFTCIALLFASQIYAQTPAAAKLAYDNNDFGKAKTLIDEVANNPKHAVKAKTWLYKGMIYTATVNDNTGKFKNLNDGTLALKAYEAYQKSLEIDPSASNKKEIDFEFTNKLSPALVNTGIERLSAANKLAKEEKLDEANAIYALVIKNATYASKINPKDTIPYILAVSAGYSSKDYPSFVEGCNQLIAHPSIKDKDKASYCEYLASYYYQVAKNNEKALEIAQKGQKLGGTPYLQKLIVELYNKGGNLDETIKAVQDNINANPNDAQNYFNLGVLYERVGKGEEAILAYEKAIQLGALTDAIYNAGAYFFNRGVEINKKINDMSLEDYNKIGKTESAKADAEFKKALPYFEKLYLADAKNKSTLDILSQIYEKLKMNDKASKMKKEREAMGD